MISFVETGDETPEDAIVVLKDPQIEGDSLTYTGRHEPVSTAARALTLVTYGRWRTSRPTADHSGKRLQMPAGYPALSYRLLSSDRAGRTSR